MERYVQQLLTDICSAKDNIPDPWWQFVEVEDDDDEDSFLPHPENPDYAPRKSILALTGLQKEQLPPAAMLTTIQIHQLLEALKGLLSACNCHVVFQRTGIPEEVQYEVIRQRFDQEVPLLRTADYFFSFCDPQQEQTDCPLNEYCECRFLDHVLTHFDEDQELHGGGETEELDFHEYYMRRKYGRDWMNHQGYIDWDESDEDYLDKDDFWDEEAEEEEEDW